MKALTPPASSAVAQLREISHSVSYEQAKQLREVVRFIIEVDMELREFREKQLDKIEYNFDCG
jgi:hypothetical protein